MTSLLTPAVLESTPNNRSTNTERNLALHKQDTREYLADMLRELSAIAAWADLKSAQQYIEAALREIEAKQENA
jgi:hypothetical protein